MFNSCLRPCFFPLLTLLLLVATSEERCLLNHSLCSRKSKKIDSNKGKFNESIFVEMKKATNMSRHPKTVNSSIHRTLKINGKMNMANTRASGKHKHGLKSMSIEHQTSVISDKSAVDKPDLGRLHQKTKNEIFLNPVLKGTGKSFDAKKVHIKKKSSYATERAGKTIKNKNNLNKAKIHRQKHRITSVKNIHMHHLNKSADEQVIKNPIVLNLNDNNKISLKGSSNIRKLVTRCNLNTNNSGVNIPRNKRCMKVLNLRSKAIRDLKINNSSQLFGSYDKSKKLPRNIMNESFKENNIGSTNTQIIYLDENNVNGKEFLSDFPSANPEQNMPIEVRDINSENMETEVSYIRNIPVQTLFYPQQESGITYPTWVFKPNPKQPNTERDVTNEIFSNKAADDNLPFIPQSTINPLREMSPTVNNFEMIQPAKEKFYTLDHQHGDNIKYLKYFIPVKQSQIMYRSNNEINPEMKNVPHENTNADIKYTNKFQNVFQPSENYILREKNQQQLLQPEISVNNPEKVINQKNMQKDPENISIQRRMSIPQHSDVFIHQHGHQYLPPSNAGKHAKLNATTMSQIKKLLLSLKNLLYVSGSKAEVGEKHTDMSAKYSLVEDNVGKAGELKLHQKKLHLDIKPDYKEDIHFKHHLEEAVKPEFEGGAKSEFEGVKPESEAAKHEFVGGVKHEFEEGVKHEFEVNVPHENEILEIVTHVSISTSGQEVFASSINNSSNTETSKHTETMNCVLAILGLLFVTAVILTIYLAAIKYYTVRKTLMSDSQEKDREISGWFHRPPDNQKPDEQLYDRMIEDNVYLKDVLNKVLSNMAFNSDSYLKLCYSSRQHQKKLRKAMSGVIK